ncbi:MAG: 4-hydroxy-3-methylbut-2-enyl diphosphate reductase [Candidatus Brocadiales bacterium]
MKVVVAKTAGFCMGVRRAVDIALEAAHKAEDKNGGILTDGPLIHNPQVLKLLKEKGIDTVEEASNLSESTVVIRAHGITPTRRKELEDTGAKVCDATCPRVTRVQSIIKRYSKQGFYTIIVGDEGHAEVVGLLGYAEGRGHVVASVEDLDNLPALDKVCVVAQTTQDKRFFNKITKLLKERYANCQVFNTICHSTSRRQEEVVSLCHEVDAMIVVGGRGSANTTRLVQICEREGVPTFHIEMEHELDLGKLNNCNVVGLTAGASTPQWLIKRMEDKLLCYRREKAARAWNATKVVFNTLVGSCVYLGIGAVSLSYANTILLGVEPKISYCIIAALFLFSMHVLNNTASREAAALSEPTIARLYDEYRSIFLVLGYAGIISCYALSFVLDFSVFLMLFLASFFFVFAFRLHILPPPFSNLLRYKGLEQFAGSKEIFFGVAWALTTALIPFLVSESKDMSTLGVAMGFTFGIAFLRAVLLDIRDIQVDRIVGRETIPIAIGKKWTQVMLVAVAAAMALTLLASPTWGWTSTFSYYLLPCVLYACLYLYLYHTRIIGEGLLCEAVVDFNFILAGIIAFFLWKKSIVSPLPEILRSYF